MATNAEVHADELTGGWEQTLLGGLLWEPDHPLPPLRREEFLWERYAVVWQVMVECVERGVGHGFETVVQRLRETGRLEEVGNLATLTAMFDQGWSAIGPHLLGYAEQVRAAATSRTLRGMGKVLAAKGFTPDEIRERLEALPGPLTLRIPRDRWREVQSRWGKAGLQLGLPDVDRKLGGLFPGDLVVVGARPSHGKTSLLTSIALHALTEQELSVAYISLEMSGAAMFRRFLGARAKLRLVALRSGALGPTEFQFADETADWLTGLPLTILDTADIGGTAAERVLLAVATTEAPVVMLDHLQEVVTPLGESRAYELGRVVGALKDLAVRREKVIFVAAQLLRQADERKGPALADLKESGGTEEKADIVLLLDYPLKRRAKDADPEGLVAYVAKNRDGGTGRVSLRIRAEYGLVLASGGNAREPAWVRQVSP